MLTLTHIHGTWPQKRMPERQSDQVPHRALRSHAGTPPRSVAVTLRCCFRPAAQEPSRPGQAGTSRTEGSGKVSYSRL